MILITRMTVLALRHGHQLEVSTCEEPPWIAQPLYQVVCGPLPHTGYYHLISSPGPATAVQFVRLRPVDSLHDCLCFARLLCSCIIRSAHASCAASPGGLFTLPAIYLIYFCRRRCRCRRCRWCRRRRCRMPAVPEAACHDFIFALGQDCCRSTPYICMSWLSYIRMSWFVKSEEK